MSFVPGFGFYSVSSQKQPHSYISNTSYANSCMIKILFIRHALTHSVGKRLAGRAPGLHLNTEGEQQANQLAQRLAGLPIGAIYSSPLERAMETAQPVAQILNLPCNACADFIEIDFGNWTNCSIEELKRDPVFERFNTFRSLTRPPGGELMGEAQLRIIRGIEQLRIQHPDEVVAIVSHADLIKAAIAWYAGISTDMLQRLEISPASISIVEIYDETARLLLMNHTGSISF